MVEQNAAKTILPPNIERLRGRVERVEAQLLRLSHKIKQTNLDPVKKKIIETVKIPELQEELTLLNLDFEAGVIRTKRQLGAEVLVPVKELTSEAKVPEA